MSPPTWAVGQVLTAADVNTWFVPQAVYKPFGEGPIVTTNLQNDDDFQLPVAANAQYAYEIDLFAVGAAITAGDIKVAMTWPAGATGMWWAHGFAVNATIQPTTVHVETTSGTAHGLGIDGSGGSPVKISGSLKTGGTSGLLILEWAENTANGTTGTQVQGASKMVMQRIG